MSTLADLLAEHTVLPGDAVDHLHAVVREWQLLADLSFGDYLMWVRRDDGRLVCVAQCRPTTAPTVLLGDVVGRAVAPDRLPSVAAAFDFGAILADDSGADQDVEAVPVGHAGTVVAVLTRHTAPNTARASSRLESTYLDCARDLAQMLTEGTFPDAADPGTSWSSPRVGDGFIRLGADGVVSYASPNALSAYRRMGYATALAGADLLAVTPRLISDRFEAGEFVEQLRRSLAGGPSARLEIGAAGAVVLVRTLPLTVQGASAGAALLVRDVTEVKRRDRALLSKDATIREIHHRVKNNLQTVSALLRLQARRTASAEGRQVLLESVRRVSSIALVHEALSMSVDEQVNLDEVIDRILPMMNDVASVDTPIQIRRVGTIGVLDADRATALTMVITELVQNSIVHAFSASGASETAAPGAARSVTIRAERSARWLDVVVSDNGRGLPDGFSLERSDSLGLQIVSTLVATELDGSLTAAAAEDGGTEMVLRLPVGNRRPRPAP